MLNLIAIIYFSLQALNYNRSLKLISQPVDNFTVATFIYIVIAYLLTECANIVNIYIIFANLENTKDKTWIFLTKNLLVEMGHAF